jgi:hypothetical protein
MRFNHTRGALMGRVTDASPVLSHDVYQNHCGGRRVKMTRPATGALCRPPRGNKTRSGAISKKAVHRLTPSSRVVFGTGSSRDGRRSSAKCDLEDWSDRAGPEILGLR